MSSYSEIGKRDCIPERAGSASNRRKLGDGNWSNEMISHRTLSREDYTVGWIAALSLELAAAWAMLDETYGDAGKSKTDNNSYTFGSMAGHNCVIACLPAGEYGNIPATIAASQMRSSFPSIRFWLLVGIGGGAPTEKADSPDTEPRRILDKPPRLLLNAVSTLQAQHRTGGGSRILELIDEMTGEHPDMRARYGPRDSGSDILFKAEYDHAEGDNCQNCDRSFAVTRPARQPCAPIVYYGTIGSANRLMKYAAARDRFAKDMGILCFEMEAAGLVDNFPCLTIRGISDYADSHKNKEWQEFAAATAAAYAKGLLGVISPISQLELQSHQLPTSALEHRRSCLKALDFDRREQRSLAIKEAFSETCKWLLGRPEYQKWMDSRLLHEHYGFLWIKGNPGTGKSTLMKFAFDNAKQKLDPGAIVISFFFNARGDELEKCATGMYRSLLFQLFNRLPRVQNILDSEVSPSMLNSGSWSLEHLQHVFRLVIWNLEGQPLICFIDALDECDESEVRDMVDYFDEIGKLAASKLIPLYFCLSSRHYPHVTFKKGLEMILEGQEEHGKDISQYVDRKLSSIEHEEIPEVKAEIIEKASGIFLWVELVIGILKKAYDQGQMRALRKRLRKIPRKLKELFKDILTRDTENMEELLLCLQWTLYANRPLSPHELFYAVQSHNRDELDLMESLADDDSVSRFILSSSKGLVEVTEESQKTVRKTVRKTVQFIHESVRDFLLKEGGLDELWRDMHASRMVPGHEVLKVCCWNYLTKAYVFKEGSLPDDLPPAKTEEAVALRENTSNRLPFLDYAVNNVLQHAEAAQQAGVSQTDFLSNFDTYPWTYMYNLFEKRKTRRYPKRTRLTYILAERNLSHLLKTSLDAAPLQAIFHNCECRYCAICEHGPGHPHRWVSPFGAAVAMRNEEVIRILFTNRCTSYALQNLDLADLISRLSKLKVPKQFTVFAHAMMTGDLPLLRLVLSTGRVDLSKAKVEGMNPVMFTIKNGNCPLLMTLLDFGADLNEQVDDDMGGPLRAAVRLKRANIAQLLLERGADPNGQTIAGAAMNSPLSAAVEMREADTVRLLLEHGADPNGRLTGGPAMNCPLSFAIRIREADIVQLLLEHGADPSKQNDPTMDSPLVAAIESRQADIVRLLLDLGADPNERMSGGPAILSTAIRVEQAGIIRLLLERGADPNIGQPDYCLLAMTRSLNIARQLLSAGANVNGDIPTLHNAARWGGVGLTRFLLETGADINSQDEYGWSPLHCAETLETCKFLIDRGADLNIRNNEGRTPIFCFHSAKVRLLVCRGAEVNIKDNDGYTPLVWAARHAGSASPVVQVLLDNGANADGCGDLPKLLSELLRRRQPRRF